MSGRGATAATLAEIAARKSRPIHLHACYLDAGTVYGTDAWVPVSWGGNTYQALGHFLGFEPVRESASVEVLEIRVSLSGVDQVWISNVLTHDYIDRRYTIYKAFLDTSGAVIVDPLPLVDGTLDAPTIAEDPGDGSSVVALTVSNQFAAFASRPGRHTNHAEQQLQYPGDLAFEFVSEVNREIKWGAL